MNQPSPAAVIGYNPRYAAAMLDNLGGKNSEMSSFAFYLYAGLLAAGVPGAAALFQQIRSEELNHLDTFARLALELGENPRLWALMEQSRRYQYWNPTYTPYPPVTPVPGKTISPANLRLLLSQAIEGEQNSIDKYRNQTLWIQDPYVIRQLEQIIAEDQHHLELLTRLYHQV